LISDFEMQDNCRRNNLRLHVTVLTSGV